MSNSNTLHHRCSHARTCRMNHGDLHVATSAVLAIHARSELRDETLIPTKCCRSCSQELAKPSFSKTQWKGNAKNARRCTTCVQFNEGIGSREDVEDQTETPASDARRGRNAQSCAIQPTRPKIRVETEELNVSPQAWQDMQRIAPGLQCWRCFVFRSKAAFTKSQWGKRSAKVHSTAEYMQCQNTDHHTDQHKDAPAQTGPCCTYHKTGYTPSGPVLSDRHPGPRGKKRRRAPDAGYVCGDGGLASSPEKLMKQNFLQALHAGGMLDCSMQDLRMKFLQPLLIDLDPAEQCGQCGQMSVDCRMLPCGLDLGMEAHRLMQVDQMSHESMGEGPSVLFFEHFPSAISKMKEFFEASTHLPRAKQPPLTFTLSADGPALQTDQVLSPATWSTRLQAPEPALNGLAAQLPPRWSTFSAHHHHSGRFSLKHLGLPDMKTLGCLLDQLGLRNMSANYHPNDHHFKHCVTCQLAQAEERAAKLVAEDRQEEKHGGNDERDPSWSRKATHNKPEPPPRSHVREGTKNPNTHGFTRTERMRRDRKHLSEADHCDWAISSYESLYAVIVSQRGGSEQHWDTMARQVGATGVLEACDAGGISIFDDPKLWATGHPNFFQENIKWLKSCTPTSASKRFLDYVDKRKVQPPPFRGLTSCGPIRAADYAKRADCQFPGVWLHMHSHGSAGYSMPYMVRRGTPHFIYDVNRSLVLAWDFFAASGMVQAPGNTLMQLGRVSEFDKPDKDGRWPIM
jgi:hypothetical protein